MEDAEKAYRSIYGQGSLGNGFPMFREGFKKGCYEERERIRTALRELCVQKGWGLADDFTRIYIR